MLLGILVSGSAIRAADVGICGDGSVDAGEQCDDGNLKNGDGCSGECTIEQCGNGIVDINEQCDRGVANGTSGDACSLTCMILFCGDGVVDTGNGEECDDGNNVSNDGCSVTCISENAHSAASESASASTSSSASAKPSDQQAAPSSAASSSSSRKRIVVPPAVKPVFPSIKTQAEPILQFLIGKNGVEVQQHLTEEERTMLVSIISKLARGERLTADERVRAATLSGKLEEAKTVERNTYVDLLRSFISTAIGSVVLGEENMKKEQLTGDDVRSIIAELAAKATIIPAAEIPSTVGKEVTGLLDLGVTLQGLPSDYDRRLSPADSRLEVFRTIKSVKEATEKLASTDLPLSLGAIRSEAELLRKSIPDLEREFGLSSSDLESVLTKIIISAGRGKAEDREQMVRTVGQLITILSDAQVVSRSDLGIATGTPLHAAASMEKLAQEFAPEGTVMTQDEAVAFVHTLAEQAPVEFRSAFESGNVAKQQQSLMTLVLNAQAAEMMTSLRQDGRTDFDERLATLTVDIGNIERGRDTATLCDDYVSDALTCTNAFLADLQEAARSRSIVTRTVGRLQDFFGVGSN
jgi:cysteine-rich repeat protein